jgi:alpha-1,6-mannosyltransferase
VNIWHWHKDTLLIVPADLFLNLLLPSVIFLHLFIAPYTKVEESFPLQATHDLLTYGVPLPFSKNASAILNSYDHTSFPGAVPRTFVGAAVLAAVCKPIIALIDLSNGSDNFADPQLVVRGVLGLFNAFALLRFGNGVDKAFGNGVSRWYKIMLVGQFHVLFYASRTLPNMFAFGLSKTRDIFYK